MAANNKNQKAGLKSAGRKSTQVSGMQGVFMVASQLSEKGFIVSPTSRNAYGADLLVTDARCRRAYTVQVKTQKGNPSFWLVGSKAKAVVSPSHVYVLVNQTNAGPKFYIVPSKRLAARVTTDSQGRFHSFTRDERFLDNWKSIATIV